MRPRRDASSDLDVEGRLAFGEAGFHEQPVGDRVQDFGTHEVGRRDAELGKPECESSKMSLRFEQTAVHDAPDFVHAVAERKPAIFDRDGGCAAREELAVQECEQATAQVEGRLEANSRVGSPNRDGRT